MSVVFANPFGSFTEGFSEGLNDRLKQEQVVFQSIIQPALTAREKQLDRDLKNIIDLRRYGREAEAGASRYSSGIAAQRGSGGAGGTVGASSGGRSVGGRTTAAGRGGATPSSVAATAAATAATAGANTSSAGGTFMPDVVGRVGAMQLPGTSTPQTTFQSVVGAPSPERAVVVAAPPAVSTSPIPPSGQNSSDFFGTGFAPHAASDGRGVATAPRATPSATPTHPIDLTRIQRQAAPVQVAPLTSQQEAVFQLDQYLNATNPSILTGVQ